MLTFLDSDPIILISDLHLEEQRSDITAAFLALLDSIRSNPKTCQALFILGDFFEVWIGDDYITPFTTQIADALKQTAEAGVDLYFMEGNRDFLLGDDFCRSAGMQKIPDPSLLTILPEPSSSGCSHQDPNNGAKPTAQYALMHGDSLCTEDLDYIQFRKMVRDPQWQQQFLSKPIEERLAIARALREKSKSQQNLSGADKEAYLAISDAAPESVGRAFETLGVQRIIHGHTHRPKVHTDPENDLTRIVLGDWTPQGWAIKLQRDQFELMEL